MNRRLTDEELAGALAALDLQVAQPDVSGAVRARIETGPVRLRARESFALWPRTRRRLVIALALLALGATVAAGSKLVIGAIQIQSVPSSVVHSAVPETGPNLGRPVSLEAAAAGANVSVITPSVLGSPNAVFLDRASSTVSLAWSPTPDLPRIPSTPWGAILIEFGGPDIAAVKEIPLESAPEAVKVDGERGYWLEGAHALELADGTTLRVTGNVLVFERGGTTIRLETDLDREASIAIAETT